MPLSLMPPLFFKSCFLSSLKIKASPLRLALHCAHPQPGPAFSQNRPLGSSRLIPQPRYFCRTQRPPLLHLPNLGQSRLALLLEL